MNQPKTTGRLINTAERRAEVLRLRRNGVSYAEIADTLRERFGEERLPKGYDSRYAWKDVMRELKKIRAQIEDHAGEIRALEVERLDRMFLVMYQQALQGDQGAVDRCLRISKRRDELLGLGAAQRVDVLSRQIDMSKLTVAQLERIAAGEDPVRVLIDSAYQAEG